MAVQAVQEALVEMAVQEEMAQVPVLEKSAGVVMVEMVAPVELVERAAVVPAAFLMEYIARAHRSYCQAAMQLLPELVAQGDQVGAMELQVHRELYFSEPLFQTTDDGVFDLLKIY